ncbi:PcfJ domain-containing protein [Hoeflea sp. TYP-13]|uniref:PcfJ domain-containing protein n=1 Tax=Hoeflea sp. TYP-13 TaxID=3230023 RepID=UPI0034C6DA19
MLDVQLRRYHRSYRRRLRKFAHTGIRMRDLVFAFPAAAFTLAGGHGDCRRRADALALVRGGAGLRDVANALDLPGWSRRIPPEAFAEPIGALPTTDDFARRIVGLVPKDQQCTTMWFQWVKRSNILCDDRFALWIAKQQFWHNGHNGCAMLQPLAAYAWFSLADNAAALRLMARPWSPKMRFAKAVAFATDWIQRGLAGQCDPNGREAGRWLETQRCWGFQVVPLCTPEELEQEGRRMNHCVGTYAAKVARGECLIYSIRKGAKSLGTVEVLPHWSIDGNPYVAQLRGPRNEDAGDMIRSVVKKWLSRQGPYPLVGSHWLSRLPSDDDRWASFWSPYRNAKSDCKLLIKPVEIHHALKQLVQYV